MGKSIDAVSLHEPHGSSIPIGPNGLRAMTLFGSAKLFGDFVQCVIPRNPFEIIGTSTTDAPQWDGSAGQHGDSARHSGLPWRK